MHVSLPHHLNMLETRLSYIDSSNIPTIFYLVISIQYQVVELEFKLGIVGRINIPEINIREIHLILGFWAFGFSFFFGRYYYIYYIYYKYYILK